MNIILIAALSADGFIARREHDRLEWTQDKALFRQQTMGCPVILGSTTAGLLKNELTGRDVIIVHRNDDPEAVLASLNSRRCFIAGGGRTNVKFAPFLTHLFLTIHPVVFGKGISLFSGSNYQAALEFEKALDVIPGRGIIQYQYRVKG
ncbi:MAG: dihydrofolate reductase family protein [Fidelibacterota bacterium]